MKSIVSHIRQSLALKLSITILLIAMPIFIVVLGFLFHQSREEVRHEAVSRAGSVLTTTSHRIRRYLNTVETANHANAWIVTENFDPDNLLDFARRIVMLNANVGGCSISAEPSMFPQCGRYFSVYAVRQGDSISAVREPDYEYFDMDWYSAEASAGSEAQQESMAFSSAVCYTGMRRPPDQASPAGWIPLWTMLRDGSRRTT